MKLSALLIVLGWAASAQVIIQSGSIQNASFLQSASGCGVLFCENFEGWTNWSRVNTAPYQLNINDGWEVTWTTSSNPGSTVANQSNTGWGMEGINALEVADTGGGDFPTITSPAFSAQSECWIYFQFRTTSLTTSPNAVFGQMQLLDSSSNNVAKVFINSSPAVLAYNGTANATASATLAINTTYYFYCHYLVGTGANGLFTISFDSTDTIHTSGNNFVSVSTGTATTSAAMIRLSTCQGTGTASYFDKFRVFSGPTQPPSPPP